LTHNLIVGIEVAPPKGWDLFNPPTEASRWQALPGSADEALVQLAI
jgi:hypothetical protein